LRHEWIGLRVEVVRSADPGLTGRGGVVVDETQKMLVLEEEGRVVKIPKALCVLRFTLPNGEKVEVDGRKTVMRPEERIKIYERHRAER